MPVEEREREQQLRQRDDETAMEDVKVHPMTQILYKAWVRNMRGSDSGCGRLNDYE